MITSLNDGSYYRKYVFGPVPISCEHINEVSSSKKLDIYTLAKCVLSFQGKLCSMKPFVTVTFLSMSTVLQRLRVRLGFITDIKSNACTDTLKCIHLP